MEFRLRDGDEHIKLGQLLKACSLVSSGVESKYVISEGNVRVNDEICTMRGKKIHRGDRVIYDSREVIII